MRGWLLLAPYIGWIFGILVLIVLLHSTDLRKLQNAVWIILHRSNTSQNQPMEHLLFDRIGNILMSKGVVWEEKKMMGGKTFMVDDKMILGTFKDGLLCRIDPDERDVLLDKNGADVISQGGREMKGYVHVLPAGYESDLDLEFWISKCLAFNPKAKSSKKKK